MRARRGENQSGAPSAAGRRTRASRECAYARRRSPRSRPLKPPARNTRAGPRPRSTARRAARTGSPSRAPRARHGAGCACRTSGSAPEQHIGDHRDVVVGANGCRTSDAMRRRPHDRLLAGTRSTTTPTNEPMSKPSTPATASRVTCIRPRWAALRDAPFRMRARRSPARRSSCRGRLEVAQLAPYRS